MAGFYFLLIALSYIIKTILANITRALIFSMLLKEPFLNGTVNNVINSLFGLKLRRLILNKV
jgi:hypothetical protein